MHVTFRKCDNETSSDRETLPDTACSGSRIVCIEKWYVCYATISTGLYQPFCAKWSSITRILHRLIFPRSINSDVPVFDRVYHKSDFSRRSLNNICVCILNNWEISWKLKFRKFMSMWFSKVSLVVYISRQLRVLWPDNNILK